MLRKATCGPALGVAVMAAVLFCACGGGSSGTTGGSSGGATTGGGTTGGGTAGKAYEGSVLLVEIVGTSTTYSAIGAFIATVASSTCQGGTPSGDCCYKPPPSSTTGGTPTAVSAGAITVVDSSTTIGTLTFAGGVYTLSSLPATLTWQPGDSLTASAAGATVDSFTGTVTAPGTISGLNPALSIATPTNITLSSSWSISWTPDTRGGETMIVTLTPKGGVGEISCSVPDSAGTVTLPAALLGNFTVGHMATAIATRLSGASPNDSNAQVNLVASVEVGGSAKFK
jgi:hypothetical protein